jgi:hypothetical protein
MTWRPSEKRGQLEILSWLRGHAQAALAANLCHPDYVRMLCGSLGQLPTAFAELDEQALEQTSPLSRTNPDSRLQQRIRGLLKRAQTVVSGTDSQESNRCLTR